jgi:hypothetical protein
MTAFGSYLLLPTLFPIHPLRTLLLVPFAPTDWEFFPRSRVLVALTTGIFIALNVGTACALIVIILIVNHLRWLDSDAFFNSPAN